MIHHLDLKPGSVVIESGTGSGSLTTSLARAVAPFGHVHSFEFNLDRVNKAKIDFSNNGIESVVTVRHRDVCGTGFPYFPEGADAVFLDLPSPWVVIDDCHRNLRPQGRLCSFSPCIEQVQRVCVRLAELGYEDIFTIEVLTKALEVHQSRVKSVDLNQLYKELPNTFKAPLKKTSDTPAAVEEIDVESESTLEQDIAEVQENDKKRVKLSSDVATAPVVEKIVPRVDAYKISVPNPFLITKPRSVMRGHTGYLTFARKAANTVVGQHDTQSVVSASISTPAEEDVEDEVKTDN